MPETDHALFMAQTALPVYNYGIEGQAMASGPVGIVKEAEYQLFKEIKLVGA